jgi:hypothetical protein
MIISYVNGSEEVGIRENSSDSIIRNSGGGNQEKASLLHSSSEGECGLKTQTGPSFLDIHTIHEPAETVNPTTFVLYWSNFTVWRVARKRAKSARTALLQSISGWYTVSALNEVRRLMKERYRRFLPEGNPWRDLATPVCAVSKRHSMWDIEAIKSGRVPVKRKRVETAGEDPGKGAASETGAEGVSGNGEQVSGVKEGQEREQETRAEKERDGGVERRESGGGDEGGRNEPGSDERGFRGDGEARDAEDDVSSSGEEEEGPGDVDEEGEEEDDLSEDEEDEYESDVSEEKGAAKTLDRRKGEGFVPLPSAQGIPHGYMQALLGSFPGELQADGEPTRGSLQAQLESEEAFPTFEPEEESDEEDEEG